MNETDTGRITSAYRRAWQLAADADAGPVADSRVLAELGRASRDETEETVVALASLLVEALHRLFPCEQAAAYLEATALEMAVADGEAADDTRFPPLNLPGPVIPADWRAEIAAAGLPDNAVRVGLAVAAYADTQGRNAAPGTEILARDCGISTGTVSKWLIRLARRGWLVKASNRGGQRSTYALNYPEERV